MRRRYCLVATMILGGMLLKSQVTERRREDTPPPDPPNILLVKLQADPDNVQARVELMNAYMEAGDKPAYLQQVLWLIANRPESPILSGVQRMDSADYSVAKTAWENQLSKSSDSPTALYNAARFMESNDPLRSVDLLEQARRIASRSAVTNKYAQMEGWIYAKAVPRNAAGKPTFPLSLPQADALKARLLDSSDPELLSVAGRAMATRIPDADTRRQGVALMERAVSLDPGNPNWQKNLETAKNPPPQPLVAGAVRIGGQVAEANLIEKVEPTYPSLAKSARVSGTVEFAATIGSDGSVSHLQLVRGHPLLVNAAKEAVLQWKYKPVLLNGNAVTVITDVIVNFTLSQ